MWDIFLLSVVCVCVPLATSFRGFLVGPGRWLILNIEKCDNPEQYVIQLDIRSKKINRTHNSFDLIAEFDREFNVSYALEIELYQEVDGGFKYHQTMKYDSLCKVFMEYAKENVQRALILAEINPPDCPVPKGSYLGRNFVMDYRELPKIGLYGTFEARVFATYNKKRVLCVRAILNFEIRNDDESVEDVAGSILSKPTSILRSGL